MTKISLYIGTSVIGGYFDPEFDSPTKQLIDCLKKGIYRAAISEITMYEINKAPNELADRLFQLLAEFEFDRVYETEESNQLAQSYIAANVLPPKCGDDARHVAIASVENMNYIVSWNFKHLVNIERIRGFNAVNIQLGYSAIDIRTPMEVSPDGNEFV